MSENISNQPLSVRIYHEIRNEILSGEFKPESKLTEQYFCKKYSVSRTPVREAFRQLEADGLIENIPNRGAFVKGLSQRDISDIFDLRALLEIKAVEWAIKRMSDEEIESLKEIMDFMEFYTLKEDADKVMQFNSKFHDTLYDGTGDRMLQRTLSVFQAYLKHSAPVRIYTGDYLKTILAEHRAIFDAVESRNTAAGRRAMEKHMENSKLRRMVSYF